MTFQEKLKEKKNIEREEVEWNEKWVEKTVIQKAYQNKDLKKMNNWCDELLTRNCKTSAYWINEVLNLKWNSKMSKLKKE